MVRRQLVLRSGLESVPPLYVRRVEAPQPVRCDGSHRNGLFATRHLVATLSGPMVLARPRTHKSPRQRHETAFM